VILAAEQQDFALGWAQFFSEVFRELNGRKTSTNDYNSDWLHSISPVAPGNRNCEFCSLPSALSRKWRKPHSGFAISA
jgi:hypothetical protein